jgi:hypothetical protein
MAGDVLSCDFAEPRALRDGVARKAGSMKIYTTKNTSPPRRDLMDPRSTRSSTQSPRKPGLNDPRSTR